MGLVGKPIVAKLGKKFGVRQSNTESLETGNILTPVTIMDNLVKSSNIVSQTVAVSIPGVLTSHTVPTGKKWTIKAYSIYIASGTYTFDQIVIGNPTSQIIIMRQTAAATIYLLMPGSDFTLTEGQFVGFNVAAVTGGGNANCTLMYDEEDIY